MPPLEGDEKVKVKEPKKIYSKQTIKNPSSISSSNKS